MLEIFISDRTNGILGMKTIFPSLLLVIRNRVLERLARTSHPKMGSRPSSLIAHSTNTVDHPNDLHLCQTPLPHQRQAVRLSPDGQHRLVHHRLNPVALVRLLQDSIQVVPVNGRAVLVGRRMRPIMRRPRRERDDRDHPRALPVVRELARLNLSMYLVERSRNKRSSTS